MDDILRRRDSAEEVKGNGYLELKTSIKLLSDKVTVLFSSDVHVMLLCREVVMHHCTLVLCDAVSVLEIFWDGASILLALQARDAIINKRNNYQKPLPLHWEPGLELKLSFKWVSLGGWGQPHHCYQIRVLQLENMFCTSLCLRKWHYVFHCTFKNLPASAINKQIWCCFLLWAATTKLRALEFLV